MKIDVSEELKDKIMRVTYGRIRDLEEKKKITENSIAVGDAQIRRKHIRLADIERARLETEEVRRFFLKCMEEEDYTCPIQLSYDDERKKAKRIACITAILNREPEMLNAVQDTGYIILSIEKQFLEGSKDDNGCPAAYVDLKDGNSFEIGWDEESATFMMQFHPQKGVNVTVPVFYQDPSLADLIETAKLMQHKKFR